MESELSTTIEPMGLENPPQLATQWARIRGRLQHEVGEVEVTIVRGPTSHQCSSDCREHGVAAQGFAEALQWEEQKKDVYFVKSGVIAWIVAWFS